LIPRIWRSAALRQRLPARRLLSRLDSEKAQALASAFPRSCVVKTKDLIGLLDSELEEIKPRGVVHI
jgi:hypothetical protein